MSAAPESSFTATESPRDTEMYRLRDLIASHIACEADCQKMPTGCGCALTAARAILDAAQGSTDRGALVNEIAARSPGVPKATIRQLLDASEFEPTQGGDKGEAVAWLAEYDGHVSATPDPTTMQIWRDTLGRKITPLFRDVAYTAKNRDETLRGLAEFFNESVHHVWSNDEIAECLTDMISTASPIPSTPRATPKVIGRVTGREYDGDQVAGMPGAICHACGLKDYPCANPDCPRASEHSSTPFKTGAE